MVCVHDLKHLSIVAACHGHELYALGFEGLIATLAYRSASGSIRKVTEQTRHSRSEQARDQCGGLLRSTQHAQERVIDSQ